MSGMEMLVKNIIQAAGIDPEKLKGEIKQYGAQLAEKIASMDRSLAEIKASQERSEAMVQAIYETQIGVALAKDRGPGAARIAAASNGAAQ